MTAGRVPLLVTVVHLREAARWGAILMRLQMRMQVADLTTRHRVILRAMERGPAQLTESVTAAVTAVVTPRRVTAVVTPRWVTAVVVTPRRVTERTLRPLSLKRHDVVPMVRRQRGSALPAALPHPLTPKSGGGPRGAGYASLTGGVLAAPALQQQLTHLPQQ